MTVTATATNIQKMPTQLLKYPALRLSVRYAIVEHVKERLGPTGQEKSLSKPNDSPALPLHHNGHCEIPRVEDRG